MALSVQTEINIKASSVKVWEILTNFKDYPKWNPFIPSIYGQAVVGETITARIEPPGGQGMTFKPKVLTVVENKELSWLGNLLFPRLFDGAHKFELIEKEDGTTTFIQSEKFTGILVPFFKKQLNNNTKNGFIAMNERLKERAEKEQ